MGRMIGNRYVPDGFSADQIFAANDARERFSRAVWDGEIGRTLGALSVSEKQDSTRVVPSLLSQLAEGDGLYVAVERAADEQEFSRLVPISEPADLDNLLKPYEGGSGNVHVLALPETVVQQEWRFGTLTPLENS